MTTAAIARLPGAITAPLLSEASRRYTRRDRFEATTTKAYRVSLETPVNGDRGEDGKDCHDYEQFDESETVALRMQSKFLSSSALSV